MTRTDGAVGFDEWVSELRERLGRVDRHVADLQAGLTISERGVVIRAQDSVAEVRGLPGVQSEELVVFPHGNQGLAFDLTRDRVGVVVLDDPAAIQSGDIVRRTGRVMSVPVGGKTIGRVVDPTGRPLDGKGPIASDERLNIERPAPDVMDRDPVQEPLQTGIVAVDSLVPIGRGQRELILGDRQTGKTSIAVDTIINQQAGDIVCIYVAIGQRASSVAKVLADLREHGAFDNTIAVITTGEDTPGQRFIAPYAATSMGEWFMQRGRDVLIVYDDLTRHARAYRELSLLLRRPPGREAYPGDIFYIHSRLLERPTQLVDERGGGSMTALPIIETQAEDVSAYIPTNLISITDGQIYLSPKLFQRGVMPAIDVGRSVSRVGGKAQLPAYQAILGDLRIRLSQLEELERFSRYGARLDEERATRLERGRRVREVLQQRRYVNVPVAEQIAMLVAADRGVFDRTPVDQVSELSKKVGQRTVRQAGEIFDRVARREQLSEGDLEEIGETARRAIHEVAG